MRTLIVIPTYDEAANVVEVLHRVRAAAPDADVLVVDDASPDGTGELAERTGRALGRVAVLHRSGKSGLGAAYRDGFALALAQGYDVVVEMDADLSHDPAALPDLRAAVAAGADLAIGSRYVAGGAAPGWPPHRRLLSRWGNRWAGVRLGLPVRDATSGYRAFRADLLRRVDVASARADGYGFQIEMAHRAHHAGARVVEVPITFRDRVRGESKMSGAIVREAIALVADLRRERRRAERGALPAGPAPIVAS